jgi:MFS family permease
MALTGRADTKNWDVVLLGGAMGSLFSFCQCLISPKLGQREFVMSRSILRLTKVSDRYGRKKVLVATMMGNILSAVIWLRSTSFVSWPDVLLITADPVGYISALPSGRRAERRQRSAQHVS